MFVILNEGVERRSIQMCDCNCSVPELSSGIMSRICSSQRMYRSAVHQELYSRDNHLVSVLQSTFDRIAVANCVAELHCALLCEILPALVLSNVDKGLSADAGYSQHRDCRGRCCRPDHSRLD